MGAGSSVLYGMDATGDFANFNCQIRDSNGIVAGYFRLLQTRQADGSLRAQFELRPEGNGRIAATNHVGMDVAGYEDRRPGFMVEMEQSDGEPCAVRFSVDIPGKTSAVGEYARHVEAWAARFDAKRETVPAMRTGRDNTLLSNSEIRLLAAYRAVRELADDRGISIMGALEALSLFPQDIGT